jgi:hypothetical protein
LQNGKLVIIKKESMGPAAVAVPLVAGGIIVGTQKRHHHH